MIRAMHAVSPEERRKETLKEEVENIEHESRMVVPGIQALFGFQLIAVFNQRFAALPLSLQALHLVALLCTSIACLCVLAPAAYHRQAEAGILSRRLARIGSRFLTFGMLPLAVGICLDVFLISQMILRASGLAYLVSGLLLLAFLATWFIFPWISKIENDQARVTRDHLRLIV